MLTGLRVYEEALTPTLSRRRVRRTPPPLRGTPFDYVESSISEGELPDTRDETNRTNKTNMNMKATRIYTLLALLMIFWAKAFGQEWEFVRTFDSNDSIIPNRMQSMTELESGDIIVNASWTDPAVNGVKSENPGIMKFSSDGILQKEVYWSRFGYRSDDQYIIESPDHNIIVMAP